MPLQRSSSKSPSDNGGNKVGRKARVALSGDYDSNLGSGGVKIKKAQKKVRVGIGGLKGLSDVARTEKKVSEKVQARGKSNRSAKSGNEKFEAVMDRDSGWKRKRVYADPGMIEDRKSYGDGRKSGLKPKRDAGISYLDKGKKGPGVKDREFKDFSRNTLLTVKSKFKGSESFSKYTRTSKIEGADKLKHVKEHGSRNDTLKRNGKEKAPFSTRKDLNQRVYAVDSVKKTGKKKDRGKKSLGTDSELVEGPPKKTKRVIRIDRHDISNKRLDDDIAKNDAHINLPPPLASNTQVKTDSTETNGVVMSKNAQFRAIRPSSSILSFVEDNLLGRRRDIEFRRAGYNTELSVPLDNVPFTTGEERERIEVPVFRNKLEFFAAAKISSSFPPPELPEIAFAGRSNVGKSSLLNALTRQWGVVRTSDKPGLTQTINFFKLGPKLSLVDLPGYGFAYAKEEVKDAWEELVKEYVSTRVGLKRVCLLIDTKWGMKPRDHELIDLMERSETKYQIVLTKTDSVFPIDVARRAMQIEENLKAKKSAVQPLMMVSSKTGAGIRSLRTVLANVARLVRH